MMPDSDLWRRIEDYRFDLPEVEFPFSAKLAKQTGWQEAYLQLAIQEYKRFVYLACVAGHPVSPSQDVDEVWHMHLIYTRAYWEDFCPKVLGRSLHHEPSTGGAQESQKFDDWYTKTLESYERIFEEPAPEWIWPKGNFKGAKTTNGESSKPGKRWISMDRLLATEGVARLRKFKSWLWIGLSTTLCLGGCASNSTVPFPFDEKGPEFLGYYWGFAAVVFLIAAIWQRMNLLPYDDGGDLPGASPYLWARLASKDVRPLKAALVAMRQRRNVVVESDGRIYAIPQVPPPADPYERALWSSLGSAGLKLDEMWKRSDQEMERFDQDLASRGLILGNAERFGRNVGFLLAGTLVFWTGAVKVLIGLSRDKPVALLLLSMVAVVAISLAGYCLGPRTTARGEAYLARMRDRVRRDPLLSTGVMGTVLLVALMGDVFVPAELQAAWKNTGSGGCGGGSGCGGDGGGGDGGGGCGGGGCGGCGS